jgi:hypothetical protein
VDEIRGLTVRPPWSWAIAYAGKTVENRTWCTRYRGLIAIHAGMRPDRAAFADPRLLAFYERLDSPIPRYDCGRIVVIAELTDCHRWEGACKPGQLACSPWAVTTMGTWHWVLSAVRPLPTPVKCKGALGLWRLPGEAAKAVRAQLAAGAAPGTI